MYGVMHDTHSDSCSTQSHDNDQSKCEPDIHWDRQNKYKWNNVKRQHHQGLEDHVDVGGRGNSVFPEIIVDILTNGYGEIGLILIAG